LPSVLFQKLAFFDDISKPKSIASIKQNKDPECCDVKIAYQYPSVKIAQPINC